MEVVVLVILLEEAKKYNLRDDILRKSSSSFSTNEFDPVEETLIGGNLEGLIKLRRG
jgi:hypothetical protein